jgi:hypothetical protein
VLLPLVLGATANGVGNVQRTSLHPLPDELTSSRAHDCRWAPGNALHVLGATMQCPRRYREVLLLPLGPPGGPSQPEAAAGTTRVEARMSTYTDMAMVSAPRLRPAARALVMDAAQRVLLVHFVFGTLEDLPNGLWACPGGGIEPPETLADGLRRELREELGLTVGDVDPPIWRKEHVFR